MSENKNKLQNGLSAIDGWAVGTGAMIGVTIFVVSGTISGMAGPASMLGFIIAGVLVLFVALCYCEIASAYPGSGGAYLYPKKVFSGEKGKFLSFISGWCLWGGQGIGPVAVIITTIGYIASLIKLITGLNIVLNTLLCGTVLILFYLVSNWFGSTGGKALQLISTLLVVGILVLFIVWGGMHVDPQLLKPFAPNGFDPILTCAGLCILSFSGWSTIPNMAEEFRNPTRDVPRAAILSIMTCIIVFSIFVYIMNGLLPGVELAASQSPPVAAMNTFTTVGALIIAIGGICACVSTSNGLLMTGSRIPFAMGRDGDLPKIFKTVNRHGVPAMALIATALGQWLFVMSGSLLNTLVSLSVCATSVSWLITIICSVANRKQNKKAPFRAPGYPVTPVIALIGLIVMASRLQITAIIMTVIWVVIGCVLYYLFHFTGLKKLCE